MAISIDPTSVEKNLKEFANAYPKFHKALNNTNKRFNELNKYWTGDRYQKIMTSWNKVVPDLNKQLKVLADSSQVLNGIFKNYTTADTKAVNIASAEAKSLTTCEISTKKEINFDASKLSTDLSTISTELSNAKKEAEKMKKNNKDAKWSDAGAINNAKKDVETALSTIITYITDLSKDIKEALKATSTDFGSAQKSYK